MGSYPKIIDDNFYDKINKKYKKYKVPKRKKTADEICFPREYELQLPQLFLPEFINPKTPYKDVIIYHRIGAGKTCTSIRIAEKWKKERQIIILLPASLKTNFRNEIRSQCTGNTYITKYERVELNNLYPSDPKYKEIINKTNQRIDKYYKIYSFHKFVDLYKHDEINLRNTILIVDEIQNMISDFGSFYESLYNVIKYAPDSLRIVLMSATPMFDKPNEIAFMINLLRPKIEMPTGKDFEKKFIAKSRHGKYSAKNLDEFKQIIKGHISYFRGAPPYVFPEMKIKYVKCEMNEFQYKTYLKVLTNDEKMLEDENVKLESLNISDLPNNFYIGSRMVSNIVFPNKKINEEGYDSLTKYKISRHLEDYSIKFFEIMKRINKSGGKIFVYSSFKEFGGIKSFIRVLEAFGYSDYQKTGEGHKRYAVWSGDEDIHVKEEIKQIYNRLENISGKKIKILLGSPSIKEGVSLTAVKQVHILEPYWNKSRLEQVIGRASRFCSHKDLPEEKRIVKVYIYLAVSPRNINIGTIDEFIQKLANDKDKLVKEFEHAIKESAIDCYLNKNANVYENEENIECEK